MGEFRNEKDRNPKTVKRNEKLEPIGNVEPGIGKLLDRSISGKPDKVKVLVLADCDPWEAQLAKEVYVYGQVIILHKNCRHENGSKEEKPPEFLGDREITDRGNLIELIDVVSRVMCKGLEDNCCKKIYLASLNESSSLGLHFHLIPRYGKDTPRTKKVSGYFLISDYVREYLSRSNDCRCRNADCRHSGPFVPFEHEGIRFDSYEKYAKDFWKRFQQGWKEVNS
jgi:hypothetical protein